MPFFNVDDDSFAIIKAHEARRRRWSAAIMASNGAQPPPLPLIEAAAADAAAAAETEALPSVLLKTLILTGDKTREGRFIEAVGIPWFDIIKLLNKDPSIAYEIPPDRWEEIVAGAYKKAGFDEVILTPRSGDHGRDVIATKIGLGSVRVIDQVKAFNPKRLVDANDVRALMGVLHCDGAAKGFLTTTSDFAPLLTIDPLIAPLIPSRLELVNGPMLFARLKKLAVKE